MLITAFLLLAGQGAVLEPSRDDLLSAIPADAYALFHIADVGALRLRAEQNDWIKLLAEEEGKPALAEIGERFEETTGVKFGGLLRLAPTLHGEVLLFRTNEAAAFLTQPGADRAELHAAMEMWLPDKPQRILELAGARVQIVTLGGISRIPKGNGFRSTALVDHPSLLGLYAGINELSVVTAIKESLEGIGKGGQHGPLAHGFLAAGGGRHPGIEAYVNFPSSVARASNALDELAGGFFPDPTGLLGLERGSWLFAQADISAGKRVTLDAHLRIPVDSLSAKLADCFGPLAANFLGILPKGTWFTQAVQWDLVTFQKTARAAVLTVDKNGLPVLDQGTAPAEPVSGVDPFEDLLHQPQGLLAIYHVLEVDGSQPMHEELGFGALASLMDGERVLGSVELLLEDWSADITAVLFEGAQAFLLFDGHRVEGSDPDALNTHGIGLGILPRYALLTLDRRVLERGLRAIRQAPNAGVELDSELHAAFAENAGATAFGFVALSHLRGMLLPDVRWEELEDLDPFDSQLIFAAHRVPNGFNFRFYTH